MNLICKLFSFFLNLFKQVVDVVTSTLVTLIDAGVEVLGAVVDGITKVGGSLLGSPFGLLVLGVAAWWLLGGSDDENSGKDNINLARSQLNAVRDNL